MTVNGVLVEPGDIVRLTRRYGDSKLPKYLKHRLAKVLRVNVATVHVQVLAEDTPRTIYVRHIRDVAKKLVNV